MKWVDFYAHINDEVEKIYSDKDFSSKFPLFRGDPDNKNNLLPSIFRNLDPSVNLTDRERGLFLMFEAQSGIFYPNSIRNSWEILYEMRHHGLPTRLLDWTGSFAIALFFALRNYNEKNTPCIWLLNPAKVNQQSINTKMVISISNVDMMDYKDAFLPRKRKPMKNPVVIFPIKNHSRLITQNSFFTVHGTNPRPLDEIFPDTVMRLDIDKKIIPDAKKFLKLINVNEFSVFPDLEGLCRHIKEQYEIP
jgi:hypothetical protein